MIDEDSKEITELIRPFIKKYPKEKSTPTGEGFSKVAEKFL